ncbi:hypothetical protein ACQP1O_17675 [Nocardia sp. CA-151230]|uniref:hypothetical protein n=1 Tax=Nocardia sp. CA-151230 TaxID=3239982 RepID=UPI003D8A4071
MVWLVVGIVVFGVVLDRLGVWAEERGWIYWRRRSGSAAAAGLVGDMQALVSPSSQHTRQELRSRQLRGEQLGSADHPLGVDLARGIAHLSPTNHEMGQPNPPSA